MQDNAIALQPENMPEPSAVQVQEIAQGINFGDPALTISYGAKPMNAIATFADDLLGQVRSKDVGPVGDILSSLLLQVKSVDVGKLGPDQEGFLSRLPLIGSLFNKLEQNLVKMQKVTDQIEQITGQLDKSMVSLLTDIQMLEQLFDGNRNHYGELSLYIEAGKRRLEQARAEDLPRLQAEAEQSGDSLKAQEVRDFAERLNRFERRLYDLQVSRTITVQTAPQIRMIQSNNQILAEKIQSSVMTTIPVWKNQVVLAITLYRQKKAVELQKKVSDTTNEMLRKNAEMLEQNSLATAREAERSVVDIETLRDVQQKLIHTIEESLRITAEGRSKRQAAEKELDQMEHDLRERLVGIAASKDKALLGEDGQAKAGRQP